MRVHHFRRNTKYSRAPLCFEGLHSAITFSLLVITTYYARRSSFRRSCNLFFGHIISFSARLAASAIAPTKERQNSHTQTNTTISLLLHHVVAKQ